MSRSRESTLYLVKKHQRIVIEGEERNYDETIAQCTSFEDAEKIVNSNEGAYIEERKQHLNSEHPHTAGQH